ncbi:glycosyltransferase family 2 protein, partial [Campylobacter jejuni]|nr:glycosyltransferase family 2 protein [Campylobacter jejuni]EHO1796242.1 glycosyltransferase family 2 protein [Campylobacter jejuni]EIZ1783226.1 glycosyltransferase family 2 protein [Campylobacter jejuni]
MPKISIILPTFNVEKYIAKALESCINQSFKDIEIIVVDDCGSDKSIDIAKEYAKKDERIKIIHNEENLGLLRARYEGVKAAGGGYIMFLDPDDYLELNACEECVRILNTEKESDFIWFDFIYKRISGVINRGNFLQDQTFTIFEYCENIIIQNKNICYWNLCSKLIKTEIYLASFSFLEKEILNTRLIMAEDALIYFFIILNCGKITTSAKNIYYYCENDNSSVGTNDIVKIEKNLQDEKMVIGILLEFLNHHKKNIELYLYVFLKIMIGKLIVYKLHREI